MTGSADILRVSFYGVRCVPFVRYGADVYIFRLRARALRRAFWTPRVRACACIFALYGRRAWYAAARAPVATCRPLPTTLPPPPHHCCAALLWTRAFLRATSTARILCSLFRCWCSCMVHSLFNIRVWCVCLYLGWCSVRSTRRWLLGSYYLPLFPHCRFRCALTTPLPAFVDLHSVGTVGGSDYRLPRRYSGFVQVSLFGFARRLVPFKGMRILYAGVALFADLPSRFGVAPYVVGLLLLV